MIETIVLEYLKGKGFEAFMEMPKNTLSFPFVLIEKTGSSVQNHVATSTLAIQSYASSLYDAAELNKELISAMNDMISLPEISKVSLNSDYNFTDTSTKRYRYQAVFDITHY